ncbi:MAG: nicotinate-nucleotide adenylyltransferase [Bacteroidetes bacterium]|jgi:nicotinate-nucleotide adenylyltransferase|nr:nicotinate-nucleotide adenylyltransferase [Bacteroidota bacterium]
MHIGLFFGSFNPVHIGHLALANYMLTFTDMDEVWFIVSPHNPLKPKASLLNQQERLNLVNLALDFHPKIKASNIEFSLPQPSYTINTLAYLKEKFPKNKFSLIMGRDNLQSLDKWKNYEEILTRHHIYVYPRVGCESSPFDTHGHVHLTEAPVMEISSTFIRKAIKDKKNVQYFLHPKVWEYVDEMNLYRK